MYNSWLRQQNEDLNFKLDQTKIKQDVSDLRMQFDNVYTIVWASYLDIVQHAQRTVSSSLSSFEGLK